MVKVKDIIKSARTDTRTVGSGNIRHLCDELEGHMDALKSLSEYVISCESSNTDEWMEGLARELNKACKVRGLIFHISVVDGLTHRHFEINDA